MKVLVLFAINDRRAIGKRENELIDTHTRTLKGSFYFKT